MSQAHTQATIRLREAQTRFKRRQTEQDGTVPAAKALQAAKQELFTALQEWRRTRSEAPQSNGSATARPETLRLKKTIKPGG